MKDETKPIPPNFRAAKTSALLAMAIQSETLIRAVLGPERLEQLADLDRSSKPTADEMSRINAAALDLFDEIDRRIPAPLPNTNRPCTLVHGCHLMEHGRAIPHDPSADSEFMCASCFAASARSSGPCGWCQSSRIVLRSVAEALLGWKP